MEIIIDARNPRAPLEFRLTDRSLSLPDLVNYLHAQRFSDESIRKIIDDSFTEFAQAMASIGWGQDEQSN